MTESTFSPPIGLNVTADPNCYRILTFDGGSSSSLQVRMLRYMEQRQPGFLARVDAFAGTSDGSFVALYLAAHRTDDHRENLAVIERAIRFSNEITQAFSANLCDLLRSLSGLGPLVPGKRLQSTLANAYGSRTLADLSKKVAVVTFDKKVWMPIVVHNFPPENVHAGWTLVDAALASSAFPVALPIFRPTPGRGEYLDGGFSANNPALAIAARATRFLSRPGECPSNELHRLRILSLGGFQTRQEPFLDLTEAIDRLLGIFQGEFINWGYWQWLFHGPMREALLIILGADAETSFQALGMIGDRYCRYAPKMNELSAGMDIMFRTARTSDEKLDELAEQLSTTDYLTGVIKWLGASGWMAAPAPAVTAPAPGS